MKKWSVMFVFVLSVLLSACFPARSAGTSLILQNTPTPKPKDNRVRVVGQVLLAEPVDLSFSISGKIVALSVKEGDTVAAGDPIAQLDPSSLQMDVNVAQASLQVAQAELDKAKAPAHPAQIQELQMKATAAAAVQPRSLIEATQIAADSAGAQAQLDYLLAQPLPQDVAAAEANVALAQQRLDASKARLAQTILSAPIAGVVTRVYVTPYEFASTGGQVAQIADLNNIHVEVPIQADKAASLKVGDAATIALGDTNPAEIEAVIVSIRPDTSSGSGGGFVVVLAPKSPTPALHWGTAVEVILP